MTTMPIGDIVRVSNPPKVPVANRCLPAGTESWSCRVWNSGRKVISRVLGTPRGELTRCEQQLAVQAISALYERHADPSLLLIALYVTAHERNQHVHGEAIADAVSELAAMSEEGALTGYRIRFPAEEQLTTISEITTRLRACVSGLPAQ